MDRENPSLPAISSLDEDKVEATGEMNGDDNLEEDVNGAALDEIIVGPQELAFSNSLIALKVFEKLVLDNVKACRFVNKAWTEHATAAVARSSSLNLEMIILYSIHKYEADCLAKIISQNPEEENFLAKVEGDNIENAETEEKEKIPLVCSLSKNLLRNVHLSFETRHMMRWKYKFVKNSLEAPAQVFYTFCKTEGDKILKMSLSAYYFKDCVKVFKEILEDFCPHLESLTLRGFGKRRFLKEGENEDEDQKKNPDDEGEGEKEEIQIENLFPNGLALKFLDASGLSADSLLIGFINKIILSSPNLVELKVDGVFCPEIPIGPQMQVDFLARPKLILRKAWNFCLERLIFKRFFLQGPSTLKSPLMKLEKLKHLTISILHRNQGDDHFSTFVPLDVKSFQKTLEGLPNLESLSLISCWCRGLQNSDEITQKMVPLLPKLKTLTIEGIGMFKLESLKILNKFENLKTLNLAQESCTSIEKYFKFFPDVSKWAMKPHTKVENLNLRRFMEVGVMKSVCAYFPNLKRLEVRFGDHDNRVPRRRIIFKTVQLFEVLKQSSLKLTHFKIQTSAEFGLANFGFVVHSNGSFFKGLKTFEFINGGPHGNSVESMKSVGWRDRLKIQLLPLQHLTSCKLINFHLEMSDAMKTLEFISAKKFPITFPAFKATKSDLEMSMAEAVKMVHRGEADSEDEDSESSGDDTDDTGSLSSDDFDLADHIEDFYGGSDYSDDAD